MTEINNKYRATIKRQDKFIEQQKSKIASLITTIESLQEKIDLHTEPLSEVVQTWVDACAAKDMEISKLESEQKGHLHSLFLKRQEIESQKEKIEGLHDALEMLPPKDIEIHERTQFQIDKTVDRLLIESLQKEIEFQKLELTRLQVLESCDCGDCEHYKAITELAVKSLKEIQHTENIFSANKTAEDTLSEIERLSK